VVRHGCARGTGINYLLSKQLSLHGRFCWRSQHTGFSHQAPLGERSNGSAQTLGLVLADDFRPRIVGAVVLGAKVKGVKTAYWSSRLDVDLAAQLGVVAADRHVTGARRVEFRHGILSPLIDCISAEREAQPEVAQERRRLVAIEASLLLLSHRIFNAGAS